MEKGLIFDMVSQIAKHNNEFSYLFRRSLLFLTITTNKQNNRIGTIEQPIDDIEMPLHNEKLLVRCAISVANIRTVFFKNCSNQHGATHHTANSVQERLADKF